MNIAKPEGAGMRLEDIPEAFCACACSIDDEIKMRELTEEVVQVIDTVCSDRWTRFGCWHYFS